MRGIWTALVTPFQANGELDLPAFRALLKDQRDARVSGVVICGTTGESPTLTEDEKKTLVQAALQELKGSGVGVVAGTGSNDTRKSIDLSRWASEAGVQGVLLVTPYYNKPSQTGLENHFRAIADQVKCDVILYNVPGRTGVSLTADTIARLASHPRIRCLKEASGNLALDCEIVDALALEKRQLSLLSGDDATFLPFLSIGGSGVISVASNLFPRAMVALQAAFDAGNLDEARSIHQRFYPLFRDLFVEANPVPIKAALHWAGWCAAGVRAPLAPLSPSSMKKLEASLHRCGLVAGERRPQ